MNVTNYQLSINKNNTVLPAVYLPKSYATDVWGENPQNNVYIMLKLWFFSQLQSLKEDKQKYKARVKDMERRLNEANQAVRARDSHLENLRQDMKKEKSTNDTIKVCRKTCLVGLLIRSIVCRKKCTSASTRVQFFLHKIERFNRPTRHVFL